MLTTIIVPLDGSAFAERSLPYATQLREATGAEMILVRAVAVTGPVTNASAARILAERLKVVTEEAEGYLAEHARLLDVAGHPVQRYVKAGAATSLVLAVAAQHSGSLVVMTTHGRTGPGRAVFGSVANELVTQSSTPLLLIPQHAASNWDTTTPLRMLVALDGSAHAEAILAPASELARSLKASLVLLRVADESTAGDARAYLAQAASGSAEAPEVLVVDGPPAEAILRAVTDEDSGIVAMATHGRTGLARVVLGSVAEAVLNRATVPVLTVRPHSLHPES